MSRQANSRGRGRGQGGSAKPAGSVRIIGGEWRGRKLDVVDAPGLRPSGDRVRETLFNWLQPNIAGTRCADLFAGTGALGFEAASRGAAAVTLVERSFDLAARLRQSVEMLSASQVFVAQADALEWLGAQPEKSLDLVFIDPPFDTDLAARALARLRERGCLAPGGRVYLERPKSEARTPHAGYLVAREKQMGEVHIALLEAIAAE